MTQFKRTSCSKHSLNAQRAVRAANLWEAEHCRVGAINSAQSHSGCACGSRCMAGTKKAEKRTVKVLDASQFHSSTSLKRQKALQPAEESAKHAAKQHTVIFNPLDAPHKAFRTQKEAFEFLDKQPCAAILRTFAQEVSATGKRVFLVTTAEQFWQRYKALSAEERHHYEIIREATPCNLYFDLEFCPQSNPGIDGPSLVQLLVSGIAEQLQHLYDVPLHPSFVLELDSSTPSKFSRHLVVKLPGLAFADCCHAGRFVRLVLLRLLQRGVFNSQCAQLLVKDKEGTGLTTLVDMGVYTRNRAFRLYLSSKYGKETILRLTPRFGGANKDPQAVFSDLLVSVLHSSNSHGSQPHLHAHVALHAQQNEQHVWQPMLSTSWRLSKAAGPSRRLSLLYCNFEDWQLELQKLPTAWQEVPMLQLNPLPHHYGSSTASDLQQHHPCNQPQGIGLHQHQRTTGPMVTAGAAVVHHGPSPYPLLEQFISSICNQGGLQGEIRNWVSMPASASVTFNMRNNRWCANVERQHKSNGIYYVVDLAGGVYYQKCYDPECRNYRSNCMPLPTAVWHRYRQQLPQQQLDQSVSHQQQAQRHSLGRTDQWHSGQLQQQLGSIAGNSCQPQAVQHTAAKAAAASDDEDQQYMELLQQVEAQQRRHQQHQQQQDSACAPAEEKTESMDEDELCLQLLQQIEQEAGLTIA